MKIIFAAVLAMAVATHGVQAGGVNAATQVPYPTQWSQPQIGPNGTFVPPVPTHFTPRDVGITFQPLPGGVRVLPGDIVPDRAGPVPDLIRAVDLGDLKLVKAILDKGADINAKNPQGETALFRAVAGGRLEIAQFLLDKGADVNEPTRLGATPLIAATKAGHAKLVQLLLASKADPKVMDEFGRMAIDYATSAKRADLVALLSPAKAK